MFGEKIRGSEAIPKDILRAVGNARLSGSAPRPSEDPIWYAGRRTATPEERAKIVAEVPSLDECVENACREQGQESPPCLTEEEFSERYSEL